MKRIIIALILCMTFGLTVAVAADMAGKELYNKKCAKCHGLEGRKVSGASGGVKLNGQDADDIREKLRDYKDGDGKYGGKKKKTMERIADKLSDKEIRQLSRYIGNL